MRFPDQAAPRVDGFAAQRSGLPRAAWVARGNRWPPMDKAGKDEGPGIGGGTTHCTVAIIDDQPIARAGMERLIADQPHFDVIVSVSSAGEFEAVDRRCDVVVLAARAGTGRAQADTIAGVAKVAHPVVASTWEAPMAVAEAFRAGARGCVTRHSEQEELLTALRIVASGGLYVCAALAERFQAEMGRVARDGLAGLAPREIEMVRWIALGYTQSQIATRMGLSPATVNTYAKRIRGKLRVTNKAELTRVAIQLGYLADDPRGAGAWARPRDVS